MRFQLTILLIASNLISAAPISTPRQIAKRGFFDWVGSMTHSNTHSRSGASNARLSNQGPPASDLDLASNIVSNTGSSVGGLPGGILNIVGNGLDLGAIHHGGASGANIAGDVQGIVNESLNIGY